MNLFVLKVNTSKIIFDDGKKLIHLNLNNLEELELNEKSQESYLCSRPYEHNLQLWVGIHKPFLTPWSCNISNFTVSISLE